MKSLYQISSEHLEAISEMEDILNGDPTPEDIEYINRKMSINMAEFTAKADAYAAVIREREARAEAFDAEIERMQYLAKAERRIAAKLQERIQASMLQFGISESKTAHFNIGFRTSQSVEITDQGQLPESYLRQRIVSEPDKQAIKQAIKTGMVVPGAKLIEKKNLQIK